MSNFGLPKMIQNIKNVYKRTNVRKLDIEKHNYRHM